MITGMSDSRQVDEFTSRHVACEERQSNMVSRQVNEWTSEQVACIKDKVTDEQSSFE
ncbi:hypothetical protein KZO56_03415 [Prevotella melaninogenica]|nr:hypothetical protein [Prevotella melaninogenica]MBW4733586.1 hypothetical protein [Prevotella melaninogenica]MBW4736415.1 hypothetical protein [Prevotella melaninogenica]